MINSNNMPLKKNIFANGNNCKHKNYQEYCTATQTHLDKEKDSLFLLTMASI